MADTTINLGLNLPTSADIVDYDKFFRQNFEKIDRSIVTGALVQASLYNLAGDGFTDDSANLQTMFDAAQGKILVLEKDKVYGIPNENTVKIKANTTIITNGAKFKKTTTGSNYCLIIEGDNVIIDYLRYVPFNSSSETGVKITGNYTKIGTYESISDSPNCGGDSTSRNALFIYNSDTVQVVGTYVGKVTAKNWERVIQVRNATKVQMDYLDIDTFKQAMYLRDVTKSKFNGAYIRNTSSLAVGNPGENGVLIEAYSDNASRDITISDWVVEDTAEHGYRVGGQSVASDITFRNCVSRRPGRGTVGDGSGSESGTGHGGCGFKVLGPTSSTKRHRNIKYFNCIAEDGRTDVSVSKVNFAGFQIGKCINVIIDNPIVRTNGASTTDRSFVNGIEIIGCEDVNINNPNIGYVLNNGIHFYDADPATAGGDFGTLLSRVEINGGFVLNPVNAGVYVNASMYTFRRIRINGTMLDTGSALYALQAVTSGTGTFTGCTVDGYVNPSTTVTTMSGLDAWLVNLSGVFTATPNNAANGSTFRDSSGTFKVRKAGAWTEDGAWANVTFQNSYRSYGGSYAPVQYRKLANGTVELRGAAASVGVLEPAIMFTLPTGFRPAYDSAFASVDNKNNHCTVIARADGTVTIQASTSGGFSGGITQDVDTAFISLENVRFSTSV